MSLADSVLAGDRLALARLLTQVENDTPIGRAEADRLFAQTGRAHLVGVTGSPGAGKSSLVNQLARYFRSAQDGRTPRTVAIVAVDPSSPFTGGAILGDRVRMRDLAGDPGVFIRSMASRGELGGLAHTTAAVVQVLDAAGYDLVLIETVGAGQAEVEIAGLAHTTIVVDSPGMGDDIQAIKAGIMEIADILVINKADRPGVENAERALRANLELNDPSIRHFGHHTPEQGTSINTPTEDLWIPPILKTIATHGEGIREVAQAILAHEDYLKRSGEWRQRDLERLRSELENLVQAELISRWRMGVSEATYQACLERLQSRSATPHQILNELLSNKP